MEKLLEVSDLHVAFPSKRETVRAVDGVSFQVFQGETFGLVGESGCGKSQTLRSILGLLKQPGRITGGEIRYKGADIAKMSQRELQKIRGKEISMIFQEPMTALNPVLRIRSQMYEAFEGEKLSKEEKRRRAIELLKLVGIPSPETRLDEYPHQFSGGMRQRAMIAIALGARPKLLLADEPTTALDVTIQDQIMKLLNQLKQELGMSIILVTHDLGVIAQMCDRVAVMYAGQIVEYGTVEEIFYDAWHPYTWALLQALPQLGTKGEALPSVDGTPPNLFNEIKGDAFAPRNKHALAIDFVQEPPFFQVSETHAAKTWYLDPRAPKIERPHSIQNLREKMGKMGGANLNG